MSDKSDVPMKLVDELNTAFREVDAKHPGDHYRPPQQPMRILYSDKGPENPFEVSLFAKKELKAATPIAILLRDFQPRKSSTALAHCLTYTHEMHAGCVEIFWRNFILGI